MNKVLVNLEWLSQFDFEKYGCPFCKSMEIILRPGTEIFLPQRGCLSCNKWIDPVRIKNDWKKS